MGRNRKKSLYLKDLISIGVYSAIYFIVVAIAALLTVFLIPGYSYTFIPVVSALLAGTIFMLMATKVQRFGAITIMGLIMGLFLFLAGRFPFALLTSALFSLVADGIAYGFKFKNKTGLLLSYIVFSFNLVGPVIPMFLFPNLYIDRLVAQGRDAAYIEGVFTNISEATIILLVAGIVIAAVIGGWFGQRMLKKHFEKAGIV